MQPHLVMIPDFKNPPEFRTGIGELGMSNYRKSRIPFEVVDKDGMKTDRNSVLEKWKSDYEQLYNNEQIDVFDDDHIQRVKLNNPDSPEFPQSDCSTLKCPTTYEEV